MKTTIQRFLEKVLVAESGCHEWRAGKFSNGYGAFVSNGKTVRAHRFAFEYFLGEIPQGILVLHRCDNRGCVNPAHLFLGTQSDNMVDMVSKGRQVISITKKRNQPKNKYITNTSGHVGVTPLPSGSWLAKIGNKYLGAFHSFRDAANARHKAEAEYENLG